MATKYLTEEEKLFSHKKVYKFQTYNGLGFNFMGETPVYLMAISFGATNIELGYISSCIFLAGFILIFLPKMLAGMNLIKVQSTAWFLRGMLVLIYLFLYFLEGRSAVILILIVYTLFCSVRMVGSVIWQPLIKMVTTSQNRGIVFAKGNIANQSASVISKLVSFILTSFKFLSGTVGILFLQVLGVIFNTLAAFQLTKIPCREKVEYSKSRNLFVIFSEAINNKTQKYPLLVRWISISILVLNSLTIVFVRKEVGFTPSLVFLYTMMMSASNILAGIFGKKYSDRVGSRPLLIGMSILLSLSLLIWIALPLNSFPISPILIFILGFFSNFFLFSNHLLVDRILVNTMPDSDTFGYNSMINFITAFFSFGSGILGGILIDSGIKVTAIIPNNFSIMYLFTLLLSLSMIYISIKIIDRGSLTAKETAAIFFSLEGLKAYNFIEKLNNENDVVKKKTVILSIAQNSADIATKELKSILLSPLSSGKGDVIKSLFNNPREELLPELIAEASDFGSYHQLKAIFTLGAYKNKEVEEVLLSLLKTDDSAVRSNAAKSLSRIGYKENLRLIYSYADCATGTWDKLNYLIALKNMDDEGLIFKDTFNSPRNYNTGLFRQTYYSLTSDLLDFNPKLSLIYTYKNGNKGEGIKEFLEITRDSNYFNNSNDDLINWFKTEKWSQLWSFCSTILNDNIGNIKTGALGSIFNALIIESNNRKQLENEDSTIAYDDVLATLYFTYNYLKS